MKLFQKLLLAPAALGLFAPVVANANESNFRDVTSYSQDQVEVSVCLLYTSPSPRDE